jgi:hypothetical protein
MTLLVTNTFILIIMILTITKPRSHIGINNKKGIEYDIKNDRVLSVLKKCVKNRC